jgi:hypothetical protein
MRSININELRRIIPRYSNTINEPNVSLKYPDIARLRLSPSYLEIATISVRSGTTRVRHRTMAEFTSARSGTQTPNAQADETAGLSHQSRLSLP